MIEIEINLLLKLRLVLFKTGCESLKNCVCLNLRLRTQIETDLKNNWEIHNSRKSKKEIGNSRTPLNHMISCHYTENIWFQEQKQWIRKQKNHESHKSKLEHMKLRSYIQNKTFKPVNINMKRSYTSFKVISPAILW